MLSILIPTNNTKYIETLFQSIDAQTYDGEFEVIVAVDGCDECLKHLLKLYDKYEWLNIYNCHKNMGVYKTINTLLDVAVGEEMIIFGSDDIMHSNMIKEFYAAEGDFKQCRFINLKDGKIYPDKTRHYAAGVVFLNRKCLTMLGGYRPWRYSADSEFVERVKSSDLVHTKIDKELFIYRTHDDNLTSTVNLRDRAIQRMEIKAHYNHNELYIRPIKNNGIFIV